MPTYKLFYCPHCKTLLYCPQTQKSKKCLKCFKRIEVKRVKILRITNSVQDAIYIVQNLKLPPEIRQQLINSPKKSSKSKSKKEKFFDLIREIQKVSLNNIINETIFLKKVEQAGFLKDWILAQLAELEKNGLLFHPQKDYLQFLI
ncbi:MAG: DUF1922 domain-containing protein [Promethearchaeota archaeon]